MKEKKLNIIKKNAKESILSVIQASVLLMTLKFSLRFEIINLIQIGIGLGATGIVLFYLVKNRVLRILVKMFLSGLVGLFIAVIYKIFFER